MDEKRSDQDPPAGSVARRRSVGAKVQEARLLARLTQAEVGRRCGFSGSTVSRLEQGKGRTDDVSTLRALAVALDLPFGELGLASEDQEISGRVVAEPRPARATLPTSPVEEGGDDLRRRELLKGLAGLSVLGVLPTASYGHSTPPALADLERVLNTSPAVELPNATSGNIRVALTAASKSFEQCRYHDLAENLPDLISISRQSRDVAVGVERNRIAALLSESYRLSSELCIKQEEDALAWVMADRALGSARESGDPLTISAATRSTAIAMRREGRHQGATALLVSTADDLSFAEDRGTPGNLTAIGSLLCTAAYSTAQLGDRSRAIEIMTEAEQAARRLDALGLKRSTVFSSTNLNLYQIGIYNTLGDPTSALKYAHRLDSRLLPTTEREARYCVDTARAWASYGDIQKASTSLEMAARIAPEEVDRPSVRALVSNLLYAPGRTPRNLRALAAKINTEV